MSTLAIMHSLRRPNGYWRKSLSVSRLLAGIAYRHPRPMKRAHIRISRKGILFMSYANQFSSVAWNYVEEGYQIKPCVSNGQLEKGLLGQFRYKSWRQVPHGEKIGTS
jgi:hypothetical protein